MMKNNSQTPFAIKSFVRRTGRLSWRQRQALACHWSGYGVAMEKKLINLDDLFNRKAPKILEIGFGMGHTLCELAHSHPDKDFIGVDVHLPGIGSLLADCTEKALTNVKIFNADVFDLLRFCIADNTLTAVLLFFPDPWPKRRHHKRRMVQTPFIELLATKLLPGGLLHIATDWSPYAEHIQTVMTQADCFRVAPSEEVAGVLPRPMTKFEIRGKNLGHPIQDFLYNRIVTIHPKLTAASKT